MDFILKNIKGKWNSKSDRILIENYDSYKDLEDYTAKLCMLLEDMNMPDFRKKDIEERVKFYRLRKGRERAEEKYQEKYAHQFNNVSVDFISQ